jgi:hypothetical protein
MFVCSFALSEVGRTLELSCEAPIAQGFVSFNSLFDSIVAPRVRRTERHPDVAPRDLPQSLPTIVRPSKSVPEDLQREQGHPPAGPHERQRDGDVIRTEAMDDEAFP